MRYPDLPIEQIARRLDTRFQFGFASEARNLVPVAEDFVLAPSPRGLHVLARNEQSLATPADVLREVYGERVELSPPRVRFVEGVQVQEPVMHVRILVERRHVAAVKDALAARDAALQEEYVRPRYGVLRYEAPLADLLGLPAELDALTGDTARHWIVLSHYALVPGPPDGGPRAA